MSAQEGEEPLRQHPLHLVRLPHLPRNQGHTTTTRHKEHKARAVLYCTVQCSSVHKVKLAGTGWEDEQVYRTVICLQKFVLC